MQGKEVCHVFSASNLEEKKDFLGHLKIETSISVNLKLVTDTEL
jgi:hypothetical protein